MDEFGYGGGGGGGGGQGGGKAASAASSAASAINFGGNGLINSDAGPSPLVVLGLSALGLIAFIGLIIVSKR